jgi:glycosyltransferase involved in cell wall biosynthesis
VLAQTFEDFTYYLLDNGSTDSTGDIVREYAARDERVVALFNRENHVGHSFSDTIYDRSIGDDCYLCTLDADDEYKPAFMEKMLLFAKTNNLDVVACGNDYIDSDNAEQIGARILPNNIILDGQESFDRYFAHYYQFMRTIWGKLYKMPALRKCSFTLSRSANIPYGGDTLFTIEACEKAKRIGILGESLHKYYVSSKSMSYNWNPTRISSDRILHKATHDFLVAKAGSVTQSNNEALLVVYLNAINDTICILINADVSEDEKLVAVFDIFSHEYTRQLAAETRFKSFADEAHNALSLRRTLFSTAAKWLLSREEVSDEQLEQFCSIGEFVCAVCENADGWLFFKKLLVRFLLEAGRTDEACAKLDELAELLPDDGEILEMRAKINIQGGVISVG